MLFNQYPIAKSYQEMINAINNGAEIWAEFEDECGCEDHDGECCYLVEEEEIKEWIRDGEKLNSNLYHIIT